MAKTFTVQDFFKRFPDDDACLDHLMAVRYGETLECQRCLAGGTREWCAAQARTRFPCIGGGGADRPERAAHRGERQVHHGRVATSPEGPGA